MNELVGDLNEEQILARIVPLLPAGTTTLVGPGDDAAVLCSSDGRYVVSVDVLVEGHHFRPEWSTGADVGARAAMQNLADIAAMGATPTAMVVGLAMPPTTTVAWVEDFARGLAAACAPAGVGVVGGDLTGGEQIMISVTVFGDLAGRPPVLRSGARVGDLVIHAGNLGASAAGLAGLQHGQRALVAGLADLFRRPQCPLGAGVQAAQAGATAMMDVSDGLTRDAARMARSARVCVNLERARLEPYVAAFRPAAHRLGAQAWDWVLGGGEDHGLLATVPPGNIPPGFTQLGTVVAGQGLCLDLEPLPVSGWDHFHA